MTSRPNSKRDRGFEKLARRLELIHSQPDAAAANATTTGFHGANAAKIRRLYVNRYAPDFYEAAQHATGQLLVDVFTEAWNAAHLTRGPGRPEIGRMVNVRMDEAMIAQLDEIAKDAAESRAETVRRLLATSLEV